MRPFIGPVCKPRVCPLESSVLHCIGSIPRSIAACRCLSQKPVFCSLSSGMMPGFNDQPLPLGIGCWWLLPGLWGSLNVPRAVVRCIPRPSPSRWDFRSGWFQATRCVTPHRAAMHSCNGKRPLWLISAHSSMRWEAAPSPLRTRWAGRCHEHRRR